MSHFDTAYKEILKLIEKFEANIKYYTSQDYQEAEARDEFITPFFIALGWDVTHKTQFNPYEQEVKIEKRQKHQNSISQRRADYAFYTAPNYKDVRFFVEAKKPSVDLLHSDHYFQTIRYGWNADTPIAVLTDFKEFHILDCRIKPDLKYIFNGQHKRYQFNDYKNKDRFAEIYYLFSRDAVINSSLEKYSNNLPKPKGKAVQKTLFKGGYQAIDDSFLEYIDAIREELARAFKKNDNSLNSEALTEAVQRTIDRLVFIRFLEDKLIEPENHVSEWRSWKDFIVDCRKLDAIYNGIVFKKHFIDDQQFAGAEEKMFLDICSDISNLNSPYDFNYIPIHILGSIYERFLGKVVVATDKTVKIEEKPAVRAANGVFYTPKYIVDYIVQNSVGRIINGKTPKEIAVMHFADIACGSGSFLIGVYECLLDYHRRYYHQKLLGKTSIDGRSEDFGNVEYKNNQWLITLKLKQNILLRNIYGVDLDQQAVEVTQLSLFLKLLEDETLFSTHVRQRSVFSKVLPNMTTNIVCGNSLIGFDINSNNLYTDENLIKLNPMDFEITFPEVFKNGGFDAIVGNPPYVFTRDVDWPDTIKQYYWDKFKISKTEFSRKNQSGKINLYVLFLLNGSRLLRENGLLSYIIPNGLLRTTTYDTTRKYLLENTSVHEIVDLKDSVFKGVTASTIIITLKPFKPNNIVKIVDANYKRDSLIDNSVYTKIKQSSFLNNVSYTISLFISDREQKIFDKLNKATIFLKDIVIDIIEGIVAHKEFIADRQIDNRYFPLIEGKDIKPYKISHGGNYILFDRERIHRARPEYIWSAPEKIFIQRISGGKTPLVAAIDRSKYLSFASTNVLLIQADFLTKYSYHLICAILNSRLINYYYYKNFTNGSNLTVNISKTFLDMIPLPSKFDNEIIKKIETFVSAVMTSKEKLLIAKTDREIHFLENSIRNSLHLIDLNIYALYNLDDNDIEIIEAAYSVS